jgi:ABC-type glycerol-3-phosphate transport system substrate-binding protein
MQDFGNQPFINNRSALGMIMTNQITQYLKDFPENESQLGYTTPLTYKVKKNFCGYRLFTIGAYSKHPDESWEFVKFMMSPENMGLRTEKLAIPPARKSMADAYIAQNPEMNSAILEYVTYGKGKPITPWTSIYSKMVSVAYEEAMTRRKTAEQALKDADQELRLELKKLGFLK